MGKRTPAEPESQSVPRRTETEPSAQAGAVNVCLLGASFETGNLGVNALAESSIKCVLAHWPDARVTLLGSSRTEGTHELHLFGKDVQVEKVPIRFCKNIFLPCHYGILALCAVFLRIFPFAGLWGFCRRRNRCMKVLLDAGLFIDISGGDSFSDIYGMRRLTLGFLIRLLPLILKKDLVMFPQTYGPFKRRLSKWMARYILKRSRTIYSRDQAGLDYVRGLLGPAVAEGKLRFSHDVAFLLDPQASADPDIGELLTHRTDTSVVVGFNVSGLIYYGGYTGGNEFGLNVDYRALVHRVAERLLEKGDVLLLLVPHVIPGGDFKGNVENDLNACLAVQEHLAKKYPGRVSVAQGRYDQCQIKYIIGLCDFFIGTRMHACIAALSQCIPAVGLAYSKKFAGVFETIGVEHLVVDLRSTKADDAVAAVDAAFQSRRSVVEHLEGTIPSVKQRVLRMLEDLQ